MSDVAYQLSDDIFNIANDDNLNEIERSEKIASAIEAALAEREAQAVQREREAARRERETLIGVFEGTSKNMQAALATYNDNSKG